jgi:hypothetical protein
MRDGKRSAYLYEHHGDRADTYSDGDGYRYGDCNGHVDADRYCYCYCHGYGDGHSHANSVHHGLLCGRFHR